MAVTSAAHALRPLRSGALAMLILAGVDLVALPGHAQIETAAESVRLTLSSQSVWQGEYGWCTLSADILQGRGGLSFRCGGAGPFGTASPGAAGGSVRRRTLTDSETTTLRRFYDAAALFEFFDGCRQGTLSLARRPSTVASQGQSPESSTASWRMFLRFGAGDSRSGLCCSATCGERS